MFHHIILTFPQIDIDPAMSDSSSLPFATGLPISLRVCPGMAEQNQLFLAKLLTEKMRKPQGVGIPYFWISRQNPYSTWEEIIWMVAQHAPNEVVTIEVVAA